MSIDIINTVGKPWDFAHTQRMEKFILEEVNRDSAVQLTDVISASGALLKYENIGDYLYEIILDLFSEKFGINRVKSLLKDLTSHVLIYDYVIEMRNIISSRDTFGADVLSMLMKVSGLILQAYNLGRVEGVISSKESVAITNSLDSHDIALLFAVEINSRKTLKKRLPGFKEIYDTDAKRYSKYLRAKDHFNLQEQVKELSDTDFVTLANNALSSSHYAYINNLYNEVDEYFYPTFDLLQTAHWQREETVNAESAVIQFFKFFTGHMLPKDFLRSRKFYIREKGVRIVFHKPVNNVTSIELREVHVDNKYDEHYITFFYTLQTGETRMFYLSMKNIDNTSTALLYEMDAEVSMMVLSWLGLIKTFHIKPEDIEKVVASQGNRVPEGHCIKLARDMNSWIDLANDAMNPDNYYYETPAQWNYDSSGISNKGSKTRSTVQRIIKVGRYTRRLPAGQNPSSEALALAKKLYIELEDGYTIVDEFERLHWLKK